MCKMVEKSVALALAKRKSQKRKAKTVMSSRVERLPEKDVSASAPGWQPDLTSTGCFVCFLSAVAYAIMSTKKKVNAVVKKSNSKRVKKVRSISMSLDLECLPSRTGYAPSYGGSAANFGDVGEDLVTPFKKPLGGSVRGAADRNRTVSACEYGARYLHNQQLLLAAGTESPKSELLRLSQEALGQKEEKFPFDKLPVDCMLKVFSFLSVKERGVASQVCSEWRALIKSSSLWNIIDMTAFPLCHNRSQSHECSELCYALYRNRVKKFFQYLHYIRPVLRRLRFAYDIGDNRDGWLDCLQTLMRSSRCQELEFAHLNWKETPIRPFWRDSATWSTSDYNELMHRHRRRQRLFVNFFVSFVAAAPNLNKLILPFDWSPLSLEALARLSKLEVLVLEKYFVFQSLEQSALDALFQNVTSLRHLVLEVWTPTGRGLVLYSIKSDHLEYLDVSQCRGFYIQDVHLPNVKVFKVSRHHWTGPLVNPDNLRVPCVYHVLRQGAPNLVQVNEHVLHKDWRDTIYPELDIILKAVCSCSEHKTSI